jgi:hypothetical protein
LVVTLVQNYRTHPMVLEFSSNEFYEGKLKACADPVIVNSLSSWKALPNKNFPFMFWAVRGEDLREADSPSFFNRHEISQVYSLVRSLLTQFPTLNPSDVAVISPYYKQTQKLRQFFRYKQLGYFSFLKFLFFFFLNFFFLFLWGKECGNWVTRGYSRTRKESDFLDDSAQFS